jgi:hypothetical protein
MAVVEADRARVGAGTPGPLARRLHALLAAHAMAVAQAARLG